MSWLDKISTEYVIKTGDGREYRPLWQPTGKSVEYNVTEFEFANVEGTLVHREQAKGVRHSIEIYFQGENCVDDALAFEISCRDSRYWTITHPYHGAINVQPVSLAFDYSKYNSVVVTGSIIETITDDRPKTSIIPADKISNDKVQVDSNFSDTFGNEVVPDIDDVNTLTANNLTFYTEGKKILTLTDDAEAYFNLFNDANAKILNATSEPLLAIQAMQAVINQPALFQVSVKNRLTALSTQFSKLSGALTNIDTRSGKKIYENNAGNVISTMCLSASTPQDGDYGNRPDVLAAIGPITTAYNQYVADLDSLQSDNGGDIDSYIPDAAALMALSSLVNYTITNLFDIALDAKQERAVILEADSNILLLTHRFYGLQEDDSTITAFMKNNQIGLNEILGIRKGRKIVYYI